MARRTLNKRAWLVLALNTLYSFAEALCSVFVGVYFWQNSHDFPLICLYYLALYGVCGVVFLPAGWYAEARDRVHLFQMGLAIHVLYYGTLLWLGKDASNYALPLGVLLGLAWGVFWAGNHTLTFDSVKVGERDHFFGWFLVLTQGPRLFAPVLAAGIITLAPTEDFGFRMVFALAVLLYAVAMVWALRFPPDKTRQPYKIWRALFPPKEDRDWKLVMWATFGLAGAFEIFSFLPGLLLFMETDSEFYVGIFISSQAVFGIACSWFVGRRLRPHTRAFAMRLSIFCHLLGGGLLLAHYSPATLVIFGYLNAFAMPLYGIPHAAVRFDVIDRTTTETRQRIAYLCAWELPLALGRVVIMSTMIVLYTLLGNWGIRLCIAILCLNRFVNYGLIVRTSAMRSYQKPE